MRAINLIPEERRRGGGAGGAGRSGGAAFIVLGTLAILVIMLAMTAIEGRGIKDKEERAAVINAAADKAEAKANSLAAYESFAAMKKARIATVSSLAKSRFDWSSTMHDIATTIPSNVWLTKLVGTVSPAVAVDGNAGSSSLRANLNAPAVEILGCTTTQQSVARMMSQMRALRDVQRVSLSSSEKADTAGGGAASGSPGDSGDCRNGSDRYPQFSLVIFFEPVAQPPVATSTATATPTAASTGAGQ